MHLALNRDHQAHVDEVELPASQWLSIDHLGTRADELGQEWWSSCPPVWLACSGAQFPADTFANMITRRTMARFGVRLSPHEFRHCAATSIAEFNPEDFHIIRVILGHAGSELAELYYIRAKGIEAVSTHQKVITRKRKELRQKGVGPLKGMSMPAQKQVGAIRGDC